MNIRRLLARCPPIIAVLAIGAVHCGAHAAIVVLDVDMPLDQVAPDRPGMKIGDLHRARIFYDDTTVDPQTRIVRVIHMEHMVGKWTPEVVGDPTMPMAGAWLDLSRRPYRYHYRGAAIVGEPIVVEFDHRTRRMTISKQSDGTLIVSAPYLVNPTPVQGVGLIVASLPGITVLNMAVTLDEVAPGQPGKVGDVDQLRIVYDANAIDPKTKRVKLLNLQHFTGGQYSPPAPDPAQMPTDDSWLDTSYLPYRLHYKASVIHGQPIIIEFDENSRRLTIHPQDDPTATLESGHYRIDPAPMMGPEAVAAGSSPPLAPGAVPCGESTPR